MATSVPTGKVVVMIGAPGSGKGTVSRFLMERCGFARLSAGAILRERAKQQDAIAKKLQAGLYDGGMVANDLVFPIIESAWQAIPKDRDVVLDGFPRTIDQWDFFTQLIADRNPQEVAACQLDISDAEVFKRLSVRKVCVACTRASLTDEANAESCTACGGHLEVRADDTHDVIAKRLVVFAEQTKPLLERFAASYRLVHVHAEGTPEQVAQETIEKLGLSVQP